MRGVLEMVINISDDDVAGTPAAWQFKFSFPVLTIDTCLKHNNNNADVMKVELKLCVCVRESRWTDTAHKGRL